MAGGTQPASQPPHRTAPEPEPAVNLFAQPHFCECDRCRECACCGRGLGNETECHSGMYGQGCTTAGWDSARPEGLVGEKWRETADGGWEPTGERFPVETAFTGIVATPNGYAYTHDRFCPPCLLRAVEAATARKEGRVPYQSFQNAAWVDTFKSPGVGRWPEVETDPDITAREVNERRFGEGAGGGAGDKDIAARKRR